MAAVRTVLVRTCVSTVAVLLVLEAVIAQFGPVLPGYYRTGPLIEIDPELGWRHIPSSTTWYRAREFTSRIDINAEGRPGPLLRTVRDGPRILIIGDSFAEAAQVPYSEGVAARLAAGLDDLRAEVVNGAVSGYATDQELLVLERELDALRPDAVVIVFSISTDVWENYGPFNAARPTKTKPGFAIGPTGELVAIPAGEHDLAERAKGLLARSHTLSVLKSGIADRIFDRDARSVRRRQLDVLAPAEGQWEAAWRLTEALLSRVGARLAAQGIPGVLVITPDGCQIDQRACGERPDLARSELPQQRLRRSAEASRLVVVDPLDALRGAAARGETVYFALDLHWTARGHAIVGDLIARTLRGALP